MKKKLKVVVCILILCSLLLMGVAPMTTYATNSNISIVINGKTLKLDQPPIMENGRTLVPLRAIFEELGATVQWDGDNQAIIGTSGDSTIKLVVGNTVAQVAGKEVKLDVPAKVVNGRTLVPTRFVAESLGAKVDWDAASRIVRITTYAIDESAIEKYIEKFKETSYLLDESLLDFAEALYIIAYGELEQAQEALVEVRKNSTALQKDFNSIGNINLFSQSQLLINRVLHNYNLAIIALESLVAYVLIDYNEEELYKISDSIEIYLDRMDLDLEKALKEFEKELGAYRNFN